MAIDDGKPDIIASATKGALDWTKEEIIGIVKRIQNKDLAFIEDSETIEIVRSERSSQEWHILSTYVLDKDLRIIAQMGLTLRRMENDHNGVSNLRNKILKVYGVEGLHIAEAVQNGVLGTFINIGSSQSQSETDLIQRIEKVLREVDKYIVFVSADDSIDHRVKELETRLYADVPDTIILYGCKPDAIEKVRSTSKRLYKTFKDRYDFNANEQTDLKIIIVLTKKRSTSICGPKEGRIN
jgi:hypothetical protein